MRSYVDADIPMTYVYQAERELGRRVARHGWRAVQIAWGIHPGDGDASTRCGPWIVPGRRLIHPDQYRFDGLNDGDEGMAHCADIVRWLLYSRAYKALVGHASQCPPVSIDAS